MPEIHPFRAPWPNAVVGWDGTAYRVFSVDAAGQLQVDVIASGLPLGAATSGNQTIMITQLLVIEQLAQALQSVAGDRVQVRGEDQLFSFKGEYGERINSTTGAAGTRLVNATNPSVGEIWVVTSITAFNISSVCSLIRVGVAPGGVGQYSATNIPTITREGCSWAGWVPILNGTWVHAEFRGCGLNDNLYLDVSGFKMTLEV